MVFFIMGIVLLYFIIGCAPSRPKIRRQTGVAVSDLANNWQNYRVYYAGSAYSPIGILFDPKNDGFKLVGDRWTMVEDEATLSRLVEAVAPGTYPSSIIGRRDDQFFGYYSSTKYTSTQQYVGGYTYNPVARVVDETTIRVDMNRQNYPEREY